MWFYFCSPHLRRCRYRGEGGNSAGNRPGAGPSNNPHHQLQQHQQSQISPGNNVGSGSNNNNGASTGQQQQQQQQLAAQSAAAVAAAAAAAAAAIHSSHHNNPGMVLDLSQVNSSPFKSSSSILLLLFCCCYFVWYPPRHLTTRKGTKPRWEKNALFFIFLCPATKSKDHHSGDQFLCVYIFHLGPCFVSSFSKGRFRLLFKQTRKIRVRQLGWETQGKARQRVFRVLGTWKEENLVFSFLSIHSFASPFPCAHPSVCLSARLSLIIPHGRVKMVEEKWNTPRERKEEYAAFGSVSRTADNNNNNRTHKRHMGGVLFLGGLYFCI